MITKSQKDDLRARQHPYKKRLDKIPDCCLSDQATDPYCIQYGAVRCSKNLHIRICLYQYISFQLFHMHRVKTIVELQNDTDPF